MAGQRRRFLLHDPTPTGRVNSIGCILTGWRLMRDTLKVDHWEGGDTQKQHTAGTNHHAGFLVHWSPTRLNKIGHLHLCTRITLENTWRMNVVARVNS